MPLTVEDKVEKIYSDMYVGDGKENPSMTTRMSLQEDITERISSNLSKIVWFTIGTFLTVLGDIIVNHVK